MSLSATTASILGTTVSAASLAETVDRIAALVSACGHHQVVTVNPEFLVAARYRPAFGAVLRRAALRTADGAGIVLAARLLGTPVRGRVPGSELVPALARRAAGEQWRLFLLGAGPGVAERAAAALTAATPGVRIAGTWSGSPAEEEEPAILARIREARPDLLFVAFGAPAQELWLARNLGRTPARVGIGVGGTFDFLAGVKPRAPAPMRQLGFEWLYRLWREPRRARRMLALPAFVALVLRDVLAQRLL